MCVTEKCRSNIKTMDTKSAQYPHLCGKKTGSGFNCQACWDQPVKLRAPPQINQAGHRCGRQSGSASNCFGCMMIGAGKFTVVTKPQGTRGDVTPKTTD